MKIFYIGLSIILTVFALLILLIIVYLCRPNFRKFQKDNMSATGSLSIINNAEFCNIDIGTPKAPFDSQKNIFSIKLKNGEIIKSNDFLQTSIKEIAIFKQEKRADKNEWGVNITEYYVEGYTFIYSKDKLLHFSAAWIKFPDKIIKPKIGTFDAKEFFELPIKQSNLEKIFGKPDKEIDSFSW